MNRKLYNFKVRNRILERDNYTCQYCGAKLEWSELHVDHIVAKSKGGSNKDENYITACARCNSSKCDKSLSAYNEMAVRKKIEFSDKLRYYSRVARGTQKLLDKINEHKS